VVEQGPGAVDAPANEVAAELLSSFNVATFKVGGFETLYFVLHLQGEMWLTQAACLIIACWTGTSKGCIRISSAIQAVAML
jgi:hypothetical protein